MSSEKSLKSGEMIESVVFTCAHAHICFLFLHFRILAAALYGQTEKNTKSFNIFNLVSKHDAAHWRITNRFKLCETPKSVLL